MLEKNIEYNNLVEFGNSNEVNAENVVSIQMHYDKNKKKYMTTISYGKKT